MSNTKLLENNIKEKIGIKWIGARRLAAEAKEALGITNDDELEDEQDEALLYAMKAFQKLSPAEQAELLLPTENSVDKSASTEPEWQRKAREAAERKEREWERQAAEAAAAQAEREAEAAAQAEREARIARGEPIETVKGKKKIVKVTRTTQKEGEEAEIFETVTHEKMDGHSVKVTKVTCCIM